MTDNKTAFDALFKQSKTLAESRKARGRKLKHRLLHRLIMTKRRTTIVGSLQRHHIAAPIITQVCGHCHEEQQIVGPMQVWSHSPLEGIDTAEITTTIRAKGMYELHKDIPLILYHTREAIAICAKCLMKDYAAQTD
ncbi:MAG: hypothetical protein KAJ19_25540 [Gammaproteobacteria bacterium]|nr:hypothetical protein [Gammaproteobacteria bacterium]